MSKLGYNTSSYNRTVVCMEHDNRYHYKKLKKKKKATVNVYATYNQISFMKRLSICIDGKRYTREEASMLINNTFL